MRIPCIILACIVAGAALPASSVAQTPTFRRKVTPEQDAQRIFDGLFAGISLDSADTTAAKKRIRQGLGEQYALPAFADDFRQQVVAVAERRNAALLALFSTKADSARFDTNEKTVDAEIRANASGSP